MAPMEENPVKFPDDVVRQRWDETVAISYGAGVGQCPCTRVSHGHGVPCDQTLYWNSQGSGKGAWEANHRRRPKHGGEGTLGNCEILCLDCHQEVTNAQRARDPDW